jgi:hypothetical protein
VSKYQPLESFLRDRQATEVAITFQEIEAILGARLPPAARAHRAWWSNNPSNNVMTRSWLAAGFHSERVDMTAGTLVFRKVENNVSAARPSPPEPLLTTLWATLAGTVHIPAGADLTAPTGADWSAEQL